MRWKYVVADWLRSEILNTKFCSRVKKTEFKGLKRSGSEILNTEGSFLSWERENNISVLPYSLLFYLSLKVRIYDRAMAGVVNRAQFFFKYYLYTQVTDFIWPISESYLFCIVSYYEISSPQSRKWSVKIFAYQSEVWLLFCWMC